MKLLYFGGGADGESIDLPDNVGTGDQSFRLSKDYPADPLCHHGYTRGVFVPRADEGESEHCELMV
jgi:hypothetical protein